MTKPARYVCEFTVRATVTERQRMLRLARQAGLSLSRYLITSALAGGPPPLTAEERMLRQRAIFHASWVSGAVLRGTVVPRVNVPQDHVDVRLIVNSNRAAALIALSELGVSAQGLEP